MATRAQIVRLGQRIEALAAQVTEPWSRPEVWVVNGNEAYQPGRPERAIAATELRSRPTPKGRFPMRIEMVIVDPPGRQTTTQEG
jgi:hypothetical protein